MADETLRDFLERRHRELNSQIAVLAAELSGKQAELAEIENTKKTLNPESNLPLRVGLAARSGARFTAQATLTVKEADAPTTPGPLEAGRGTPLVVAQARYAEMTIKELVLEALKILRSASAMKIREFIREGFSRSIEADSLRPQLSRLKADEIIAQNPQTDEWYLTAKATAILMFDHPTSRKSMPELKDEPGGL